MRAGRLAALALVGLQRWPSPAQARVTIAFWTQTSGPNLPARLRPQSDRHAPKPGGAPVEH
jgi:hypothetical protein